MCSPSALHNLRAHTHIQSWHPGWGNTSNRIENENHLIIIFKTSPQAKISCYYLALDTHTHLSNTMCVCVPKHASIIILQTISQRLSSFITYTQHIHMFSSLHDYDEYTLSHNTHDDDDEKYIVRIQCYHHHYQHII